MVQTSAHILLTVPQRPGPGDDPDTGLPVAGLILGLDADQVNDRVVRGLLGRGFELVAAPADRFEPVDGIVRGHISCATVGRIEVTVDEHLLYSGPPPAVHDMPLTWVDLAQTSQTALLYVALGHAFLCTEAEVDDVARAGFLVGSYASLDMSSDWAEAHKLPWPEAAQGAGPDVTEAR